MICSRAGPLFRLAALALAGLGASPACAGEPPSAAAPGGRAAAEPASGAADGREEGARRETELRSLEEALAANAESRRRLEAEIAEIAADRAKLAAALIETTERARATEDRIEAVEGRLAGLTASDAAIRRSLQG